MANSNAPYHPIVYVRGFAMTRGEIDDTAADPFCGFNLGSTTMRASASNRNKPRKYIFESPVVRLASEDFGYTDVYEDGLDILDPDWERDANGNPTGNRLGSRSVIIYRYYDEASTLLGNGETPSIEHFAQGLSRLISEVRRLLLANPKSGVDSESDFRCYLVAHSMGGLVCRAFLQNPKLDPFGVASSVDKLFTYATPHNGIDILGLNVPAWMSGMGISNFNRGERMKDYLALGEAYEQHGKRVDLLPETRFPSSRVFTMVGTNRLDYEAAAGLSRTFVGNGSDGLVRIENATLHGLNADGTLGAPCAKAFAYRAHSGHFGIVNSEEAFQNLTRFLFGDVRVDIWLDIDEIRLPPSVARQVNGDESLVDAIYQIEVLASPRGKLWYLTRRTAEEDSVACVTHARWREQRSQYLSSVFLANRARVNPRRRSLAYGLTLNVRVPDYEIDKRLWLNEHFEGGYLFRNSLVLEMEPPHNPGDPWKVKYAWQDAGVALADTALTPEQIDDRSIEVTIPFDSVTIGSDGSRIPSSPGIKGKLRFAIQGWNQRA